MNLNFRMKKRPVRQADLAELKINAKGVPDPLTLSALNTDDINEKTLDHGVSIESVLMKDNTVMAYQVYSEKTYTDKIEENTSNGGVTIDGVLLKDADVTAFQYKFRYTPLSFGTNGDIGLKGTNGNDLLFEFRKPSDGVSYVQNKFWVMGSLRVENDSDAASSLNVGAIRYAATPSSSKVDMCMQTGAATYAWVNIKTNNW